jgi:hypothetical protein
MPTRLTDAHLRELAKRGARARLAELAHEAQMLLNLFPHLRDSFDADELPVKFILRRDADRAGRGATAPRRRRQWTAAQRAVVAKRMKAYWATRKSGK